MQVSGKQKTFSAFSSSFLKYSLTFEHFSKKDDSHSEVFPKLRSPKNNVRSISIKSRFKGSFGKQHLERENIVEICMAESLPYLLIAVKAIDFQKVSVSDMQNIKTVS